jgi:energy-coupling factor transporter ATP-binding protein EcfA2
MANSPIEIAVFAPPPHSARLPAGKTFDTFDFNAVPMVSKAQVTALATGDGWLDQGANILLFGPPGAGKSHLAAALGLALVQNGRRVLFGLVRAQVPSDVAHDFFMLRYRHQPESRPAPVNEFEAAMEALCRVFGAETHSGPIRPASTTLEESTRDREKAQVRTAA